MIDANTIARASDIRRVNAIRASFVSLRRCFGPVGIVTQTTRIIVDLPSFLGVPAQPSYVEDRRSSTVAPSCCAVSDRERGAVPAPRGKSHPRTHRPRPRIGCIPGPVQ